MSDYISVHARIAALQQAGERFVTATVVQRRAPVSSHLGDRAIIYPGGRMEGFVGGACSRDIVRRQALAALELGQPRLVMIRPDASELPLGNGQEVVVVPMTCASEGAVNIYLEPHLPARLLIVAGLTPVAGMLARLGTSLGERVMQVVSEDERQDLPAGQWAVTLADLPAVLAALAPGVCKSAAAVVASQGHYDELALEALLHAGVGDVALLSSRRRAVSVRELLTLTGVPIRDVQRVQAPAGLDLGGQAPGEVALAILAGIVARRYLDGQATGSGQGEHDAAPESAPTPERFVLLPDHSVPSSQSQTPVSEVVAVAHLPVFGLPVWGVTRPGYARSPVDGEEVQIAGALHHADHQGQRYYFTCPNCKRRFLKDPAQYVPDQSLQAMQPS